MIGAVSEALGRVDTSRLRQDLVTLAGFGASTQGITRPSWSSEYLDARDWLATRCTDAGLAVTVDPIGNLWATWDCGTGPSIVVGSHIDTVLAAGSFDGCLGVLGGLEAIRSLREGGFRPSRPVRLVAWVEEEGTSTGRTLLGSSVFVGEVLLDDVLGLQDGCGTSLAELLDRDKLRSQTWDDHEPSDVGTYLELHIEQGPVLDRERVQIGVVNGIVGYRSGSIRYEGIANHAGTTPMDHRQDALVSAAMAVVSIRDLAVETGVTATVGRIVSLPNAANVIPRRVEFSFDVRSVDDDLLDRYLAQLHTAVSDIAQSQGVDVVVDTLARIESVALDRELQGRIAAAADRLGFSRRELPSGALHDAAPIARRIPAGMIFVPSIDGISHAPEERTEWEDCAAGAAVLAEVVRGLCSDQRDVDAAEA